MQRDASVLTDRPAAAAVHGRFRRWLPIAASLVALTIALLVGPAGARSTSGPAVTIRTLAHHVVIADIRMDPPPAGYVPGISGERAVILGREEFRSRPSTVVATLVSDPVNGPEWIVALKGVCKASQGPGFCYTELNVVLSARTGEFLYEFSYR